ncbi:MAG TPA: hypothetical protein VH207_04660 [Chthoniobacterales bacterium]|jgi:hypothetical protein|nr:hypothetical protein [Chthoniobacterales bacterium]
MITRLIHLLSLAALSLAPVAFAAPAIQLVVPSFHYNAGNLDGGTILTVLSNTSSNPINRTFSNLPNGAIITVNGNDLEASYTGGDGNDLTLIVVP